MRSHFAHHYRPSPTDLESIWKGAIVALDANVLLNLYRYTVSTRDELLSVLGAIQERLWIPHQAASEYFENRLEVMDHQRQLFDRARLDLKKTRSALEQLYTSPVKEGTERKAKAESAWIELESYIDAGAAEAILPTADIGEDPVLAALTELLVARVGEPYGKDRMAEVLKEASARHANRIPPGYADATKPDDRKFGDVVLWMQLVEHAREQDAPMIFVTDDAKEDWWARVGGRTVGPRPALVEEMRSAAGQSFWIYRAAAFMQYAGDAFDRSPSGSAVEEVEELPPLAQEPGFEPSSSPEAKIAEYVRDRRATIHRIRRRREADLAALDAAYADATDQSIRENLVAERRAIVRTLEAQDRELMRIRELEDAVSPTLGRADISVAPAFYDAPGVARDAAPAVWSVPGYTERATGSNEPTVGEVDVDEGSETNERRV